MCGERIFSAPSAFLVNEGRLNAEEFRDFFGRENFWNGACGCGHDDPRRIRPAENLGCVENRPAVPGMGFGACAVTRRDGNLRGDSGGDALKRLTGAGFPSVPVKTL